MTWHFSPTPRKTETRAGVETVIFNVVLETDAGMFAFTGFRVIGGRVVPPAVLVKTGKGTRYVDTVLFDEALMRSMVKALRERGFPVAEGEEEAVGAVLTQERVQRVLQ